MFKKKQTNLAGLGGQIWCETVKNPWLGSIFLKEAKICLGGILESTFMHAYTTISKWLQAAFLLVHLNSRELQEKTRRFSNHESHLLSRSHTFAIIVILDLKIHQSMWIHWPFLTKTWTKGHWPLDDLWPHVCWGHMCDSIQGSLCPSPMTIHQCMWIQWSILQNTTYILHTTYILRTYYGHTTYRMSDHIVSYWTQFRWDKKVWQLF